MFLQKVLLQGVVLHIETVTVIESSVWIVRYHSTTSKTLLAPSQRNVVKIHLFV
jgi:hypothetical protein